MQRAAAGGRAGLRGGAGTAAGSVVVARSDRACLWRASQPHLSQDADAEARPANEGLWQSLARAMAPAWSRAATLWLAVLLSLLRSGCSAALGQSLAAPPPRNSTVVSLGDGIFSGARNSQIFCVRSLVLHQARFSLAGCCLHHVTGGNVTVCVRSNPPSVLPLNYLAGTNEQPMSLDALRNYSLVPGKITGAEEAADVEASRNRERARVKRGTMLTLQRYTRPQVST